MTDFLDFTEGQNYLLTNGLPATCYFLLSTNAVASFTAASTLAGGVAEITGTGYARQSQAKPTPSGGAIGGAGWGDGGSRASARDDRPAGLVVPGDEASRDAPAHEAGEAVSHAAVPIAGNGGFPGAKKTACHAGANHPRGFVQPPRRRYGSGSHGVPPPPATCFIGICQYSAIGVDMRVKMLRDAPGSPDGIQVNEYLKGDVYEVSVSLGQAFLEAGFAELDKPASKPKVAEADTKMADGPAENK